MSLFRGMLLSIFLFAASVFAQQEQSDSTKTYPMHEVVITGTRTPTSLRDSPSKLDLITPLQLEQTNAATIDEVLEGTSSAYVVNYGGGAALKSILFRGTSSNNLLVLVNGNRLNSFQFGAVDFSLLPLENIDRIEVLHGGSSALYGADASGGIVNILTRQPGADLQMGIEQTAGSFGYQRYRLHAQQGVGAINFLAGYSAESGRGNYPFTPVDPSLVPLSKVRDDADFIRQQTYLNARVSADSQSVLDLSTQYIYANRGVPKDISFYPAGSFARQNDNDAIVNLSYTDCHTDGLEMIIRSSYHYNYETYVDPDPSYPLNSFYKNWYANINPQAQFSLGQNNRVIFGGEFAQGALESGDFASRIVRAQKALYLSDETRLDFDRETFDRILFYQALRYDNISDVDFAVTPKVGMNVRVFKRGDVRLRTSLSQNFRSPTFNDLYYVGYSNPDLKPERSTDYDAGLSSSFDWMGYHSIDVTYFNITTENRILPDQSFLRPINIGRALSRGLEVSYDGSFFHGGAVVALRYTYTDARKTNRSGENDPTYDRQLRYVPKDNFNISLTFTYQRALLSFSYFLVGTRYTSDDNSTSLAAYRLTNVGMGFRQTIGSYRCIIKGEVNNLFGVNYESYAHYPMPERNYRATLGLEL